MDGYGRYGYITVIGLNWNFHKCTFCSFRTRFLYVILRHVKRHRPSFNCSFDRPGNYWCEQCRFRTDIKVLLMWHFNKAHRKREIQHYLRPVIYCEDCNFQTHSSLVLLRHNCSNITGSNCLQTKRSQTTRKNHVLRLHTPSELINWLDINRGKVCVRNEERPTRSFNCYFDSPKKYCCKECRLFRSEFKVLLMGHFNKDHKKKEIQCNLIRPVMHCEDCNFQTFSTLVLLRHKCTGSNSSRRDSRRDELGRFRCGECPFKSTRKESLKNHVLRLHAPSEQIKWFECERCSYKAKFKGDLKQHIRAMHTSPDEIHWFKCELCSYKTKYKYSLRKHTELDMHKPLKCDHCSFRTTTDKYLKSHLRKRHTELIDLFKCEYCSYKTNLMDDLSQHVLLQHLQPTLLSQPLQPPVPQHLQPSALSQLLQSAVLSQYLQPPVQHLQPPVLSQYLQPPVQYLQPPVQHLQPPVQHLQPPVQHLQPPVQHLQPPVQHLQPPVLSQHLQPPVLPHHLQPSDLENLQGFKQRDI